MPPEILTARDFKMRVVPYEIKEGVIEVDANWNHEERNSD
jgi:hypothetical protein